MNKPTPSLGISADRPLNDPNDDALGYSSFAQHITDGIKNYTSDDGIVLAIYGPWGSGKSTILNFIKHYLKEEIKSKQIVSIDFNPWWFSGQDNLARSFFTQLAKKFDKTTRARKWLAQPVRF